MVVYVDDRIEGNDTPLSLAILSLNIMSIIEMHYTNDTNTIISAIDNPTILCIFSNNHDEINRDFMNATDKSVFAYISSLTVVKSFMSTYKHEIDELRVMKFPKSINIDDKYKVYRLLFAQISRR